MAGEFSLLHFPVQFLFCTIGINRNADSGPPTTSILIPDQTAAHYSDTSGKKQTSPDKKETDAALTDDTGVLSLPAEESEGCHDGMLLRDVPKRTTFYDPVAERQMSQTDAKLFYQRSKIEARSGNAMTWGQSSPSNSPIIASKSRPSAEHVLDYLNAEQETGTFWPTVSVVD